LGVQLFGLGRNASNYRELQCRVVLTKPGKRVDKNIAAFPKPIDANEQYSYGRTIMYDVVFR
jgi:hypothetical protein